MCLIYYHFIALCKDEDYASWTSWSTCALSEGNECDLTEDGMSGTMTRTRTKREEARCSEEDEDVATTGSQDCNVPCGRMILYRAGCKIGAIHMRGRGVYCGDILGGEC